MKTETVYMAERSLTALALVDGNIARRINPYMITNEKFRELLKHILETHPGGMVTKDYIDKLTSETSFDIGWTDLEILLEKRDNFTFYDEEVLEQIFNENMKIITDHNKVQDMKVILGKAQECLERGQLQEAQILAHSIQVSSSVKLPGFLDIFGEFLETDWGFRTGLSEFDDDGGLSKGNLMALIADTGAQKTMFSLWFMIQILAHNPKFKGLYFEKEMHEIEIAKRLISFVTRIDNRDLSKFHLMDNISKDEEYKRITEIVASRLESGNIYHDALKRLHIVSGKHFANAMDIYGIVKEHNADIWCLDYMTMLEPKSGTLDEESTRKEVKILKEITVNLNSFGIVLSQIKHSNGLAQRYNKIPELDDMEWGKPLKQLSSWIYSIFMPHLYYKQAKLRQYFYLIPRKGRNGPLQELMFVAEPEKCNYLNPRNIVIENEDENAFVCMAQWLSEYRTDKRKKDFGKQHSKQQIVSAPPRYETDSTLISQLKYTINSKAEGNKGRWFIDTCPIFI